MSELLQHSITKSQVESFLGKPTHALLLEGAVGAGKTFLATHIASRLLDIPPDGLTRYPYFWVISPEGSSISITQIRELKQQFVLKIPGVQTIKRVAIIEHADTMTTEAQNALLKLLEEPPNDSALILTTANKHLLLPTVVSRTSRIMVHNVSSEQLTKITDDTSITRLAYGRPGLAHSMANDSEHPLKDSIALCKKALAGSKKERLLLVNDLTTSRSVAQGFLNALVMTASAALNQSARSNPEASKQWHHTLYEAIRAENALNENANLKLILTDLMVHL